MARHANIEEGRANVAIRRKTPIGKAFLAAAVLGESIYFTVSAAASSSMYNGAEKFATNNYNMLSWSLRHPYATFAGVAAICLIKKGMDSTKAAMLGDIGDCPQFYDMKGLAVQRWIKKIGRLAVWALIPALIDTSQKFYALGSSNAHLNAENIINNSSSVAYTFMAIVGAYSLSYLAKYCLNACANIRDALINDDAEGVHNDGEANGTLDDAEGVHNDGEANGTLDDAGDVHNDGEANGTSA